MNPKWLLPISMALGLGLLGVAGAARPLQKMQLWLDQRDSPHTAAASALAPIIDCVNRVDRDTRLTYYPIPEGESDKPTLDNYGDRNEPEPYLIRRSVCSQQYTVKLARQAPASDLLAAADAYAQALYNVTALADGVTRLQPPAPQELAPEAANKQLQVAHAHVVEKYLAASTSLRQQLADEDLRVRPAQLALLQARFGRDMQWHLLNYMITARQAVNQIEQGVRATNLTPQRVADLADAVHKAAEDSRVFMNTLSSRRPDDEAIYLWYNIKAPADEYLKALNTLRQDWQDHAAPQQLSDDYYLVTRRYDALLSYYNRLARNAF
ncbi:hypothetical protein PspS35_14940 [Pseudomonas sp. S35]|uniref:DUF3829 domain-containing protein n=1 Tax=Pseudomonas sp. S35 TaxID=1573719 RepID=UPI00132F299E|nr:DUF3829 domain-containing protein [Pseudomonas sp. S35]QHF45013.1 hypothetical protein PspS35_14940 [Pseudomonas sp. S35]